MNEYIIYAFIDELEKLAGKFDEESYNKFKAGLQTGDIVNFDRNTRHIALEHGTKNALQQKLQQVGSKFFTGSKHYHTGLVEKHPETGEITLHHQWYGPDDKLQIVSEPLDNRKKSLSSEDIKAYRPKGTSKEEAHKAIEYAKSNVGVGYEAGDKYSMAQSMYLRRTAKKYEPGSKKYEDVMNQARAIENKHAQEFGGLTNCDASGVCSTLPAKAYSQSNPEFAKKHLGVEGNHRLISPAHYEHAAKEGLLDAVGEYNFADRDISRTKAFFKGLGVDIGKRVNRLKARFK